MDTPTTTYVTIKNLSYIPAMILGLSMHSYSSLAVLLIIDVITGAWRSSVLEGGQSVTSWKAVNGLVSKFLFLLIPLVVAFMGKGIGLELVSLAQSALGVLILATGYSIIGNIYTIRTGIRVKEFDAIRIILKQIEALLEKFEPQSKK